MKRERRGSERRGGFLGSFLRFRMLFRSARIRNILGGGGGCVFVFFGLVCERVLCVYQYMVVF